jgi:hypothetical protein
MKHSDRPVQSVQHKADVLIVDAGMGKRDNNLFIDNPGSLNARYVPNRLTQ